MEDQEKKLDITEESNLQVIYQRIDYLIRLLKTQKSKHPDLVDMELNGLTSVIPEYRKLTRSVVIEVELNDLKTFECRLIAPKTHPESLYYENFVLIHVATGLLYLSDTIETLLKEELLPVEIEHLENIFDFSGQIRIKRAYFEINEQDIHNMLHEIHTKCL